MGVEPQEPGSASDGTWEALHVDEYPAAMAVAVAEVRARFGIRQIFAFSSGGTVSDVRVEGFKREFYS
jgi:hypothetical protein